MFSNVIPSQTWLILHHCYLLSPLSELGVPPSMAPGVSCLLAFPTLCCTYPAGAAWVYLGCVPCQGFTHSISCKVQPMPLASSLCRWENGSLLRLRNLLKVTHVAGNWHFRFKSRQPKSTWPPLWLPWLHIIRDHGMSVSVSRAPLRMLSTWREL